jgi:uncharacterized membrane protein YgaE (UPF0421/DUF939 family)
MRQNANRNLGKIWNWFISTDPGLIRLRMATWAVLTAAISYLLLTYLSKLLEQPAAISLLGVIVAVSAIAVNDPDLPDQRLTTLLIPAPALMAVLLGELVAPIPLIKELALLGIIFAAVRLRRFSARGTVLGLIIFITYLFSSNLSLPVNRLPWAVAAILLGTLIAFLVRFVILPAHPAVIFGLSLRAFQARTNALLNGLIDLVQYPQDQDRHRQKLLSQLYKIGDLAIDLELLLGLPNDSAAQANPIEFWRTQLMEFELSLETLVEATSQIVREKLLTPEKLAGLADFFGSLQASLQPKTPLQPLRPDILKAYRSAPGSPACHLALSRMEWAAQRLIECAPWQIPKQVEEHLETTNILSPHLPAVQASADNLKLAVQATIAVGLALLAGVAISGTRWYWAVIAAFVIFTRTSTIEEAFSRAWQRVAGTLAGVVVGILLVQVIIDDPRLEVTLLLAGFFIAYFLVTLTYTGFVFVLTVVLAILYRLLGAYQPGLLVLRLEETLAGATAGVLVALLIFPRYRSTKNQATMTKIMQKISQSLEPMLPSTERAQLSNQLGNTMREIDQQLKILRSDLSSLGGRFLSLSSPAARQRLHKLSLLEIAIRHYLVASRLSQSDSQFQQQNSSIERSLAENAMLIANALEDQTPPTIQPPDNLLLQSLPSPALAAITPEQGAAIQWLARISQLQNEIAENL